MGEKLSKQFVGTTKNPKKTRLERVKEQKKEQNLLKMFLWTGLVIWFLIANLALSINIVNYIQTHELRSPIVEKQVKFISPVPTKKPETKKKTSFIPQAYASDKYNVSEIVDRIFTLESSRGRNDGCRDKGLYNGYGYAQSTFTWNCYETQGEVVRLVSSWVQDKIDKGFMTAESLCYYNEGIKKSDCPYYQKFLSLN